MGEKEELKHFFTSNGEAIEETPEISISDGAFVIEGGILHRNEDGTLCSIGKPLSIELECKLSNELFWTLVAPNRINQNNFRKKHGIPKRRKINGSRKNKRLVLLSLSSEVSVKITVVFPPLFERLTK